MQLLLPYISGSLAFQQVVNNKMHGSVVEGLRQAAISGSQ